MYWIHLRNMLCNILPRPVDSNGLIVVKLREDLNYRCYVYIEAVGPCVIFIGHFII